LTFGFGLGPFGIRNPILGAVVTVIIKIIITPLQDFQIVVAPRIVLLVFWSSRKM
jgi:hypothetical protein